MSDGVRCRFTGVTIRKPTSGERMSQYEREFVRALFDEVLTSVAKRRFIVTADRWFADVDLLDVLNELGISYVIRTKSNYKVRVDGAWRRLDSLRWTKNHRKVKTKAPQEKASFTSSDSSKALGSPGRASGARRARPRSCLRA